MTLKIVNVKVLTSLCKVLAAYRIDPFDVHLEFDSFGFEMLPLGRVDFRINLQTRKRIGKHGVEVLVSVLDLHFKNIIVVEILRCFRRRQQEICLVSLVMSGTAYGPPVSI